MNLRWWNPISWVIVPIIGLAKAIRGIFPWTPDGRRTSLHVSVLFASPVLTGFMVWQMNKSLENELFVTFTNLAYTVAAALLIVVTAISVGTGLNFFFQATKNGATFNAGGKDVHVSPSQTATNYVEEVTDTDDAAKKARDMMKEEQGEQK